MAEHFDWWVYSTALTEGTLLVRCRRTGKYGVVENPTREEWNQAFYAPSSPYRWTDHSRVKLSEDNQDA
jgi:hypothetical protein